MHQLLNLAISFSLTCGCSFAPNVPPPDVRAIVERFERTYRSSRTLQATFLQRYIDNGKEVRSEAGVAYFARPGKMRWEYESPEANLYIVDGKWSWFYVPADHTVTRVRAKESADARTPFALLAGEMKVSRICESVEEEKSVRASDEKGVVLRCSLRGEAERAADRAATGVTDATPGRYALFELVSSTGELRRVVVTDPGGVQVEFQFSNWEYNPQVRDGRFRFSAPQGVAIVDGDLGASSRARDLK